MLGLTFQYFLYVFIDFSMEMGWVTFTFGVAFFLADLIVDFSAFIGGVLVINVNVKIKCRNFI